jgi:hypothetical protein
MHLHDRHPTAVLVDVDAVGDRLGLVGFDELDQLRERRLELVDLPFPDLGAVDDDDWIGRACAAPVRQCFRRSV